MQCKYRIIVSVDGGGLRGIIPLRIISYLHDSIAQFDRDLDVPSWVDMFSSCSASSIFTGALMLKDEEQRTIYTPKDILDFYLKRGSQIFNRNLGVNPQNSMHPLNFTLNRFFSDYKLNEIKSNFLFISYEQKQGQIYTFSNYVERMYNLSLAKMMYACTADENYPAVKIGHQEFTDASNYVENPAQMAYDYARMLYPNEHLILISMGCGRFKDIVDKSKEVHESMSNIAQYDDRLTYYRFQPTFESKFSRLNQATPVHMHQLLDQTEDYIFKNQSLFMELLQLMALRAA